MTDFSTIDMSPYDTLLLDRDGVINVLRPHDYVKRWEEFRFIPAFLDIIPQWTRHFARIYIVTNQRGVGRGIMSEETLLEIHQRMTQAIREAGGRIDGIYYCTAVDDADPNRKPNRGLFDRILREHPEVDPRRTVMVGDSDSDLAFARNAGIAGIRV
jgi:D-glycero-D-manno-heptose 1,7-bisphosphate phosphatase/D-glycero-alpha-D-manno-heptose 1-phosphate guanylyltransferase